MSRHGYYRLPTVHGDRVYFICEDDIWCVAADGGLACRLTSGLGEMGRMAVSPDGESLAITSREELHSEVFLSPAAGGPLQRLTYLGADSFVRGFTPDGDILFTSNAKQPFLRAHWMYRLKRNGGLPTELPFGPALELSFGSDNRKVLGRNTGDPARWKRYRGGTAGKLWIDTEGNDHFKPLLPNLRGNLASPMWIGGRIFFLSDHEGIGNLYSVDPQGEGLQRHTHHENYFARGASADGERIVYQCGGDIRIFNPADASDRKIEIAWQGPATQTQRRFVKVDDFFDDYSIHPEGHSLAIDCRGKPMTLGFWEGPVRQHGIRDGVRYRFPQWLNDGKTIVAVSDASGEERIEILDENGTCRRLEALDLGRVVNMVASPAASRVAVTNHRLELLLVDLAADTISRLDSSRYRRIEAPAWSPDGAWLAYDFATSPETSAIKLCDVDSGRAFLASTPDFRDFAPAFDPEGKFLYFLSHRTFDPVYDSYYFNLSFPRSVKPCLIVLSASERSPFVPLPHAFEDDDVKSKDVRKLVKVHVDAEGIETRILTFPAPEGIYRQIGGLPGKVLFTSFAVAGSLNRDWSAKDVKGGDLQVFDFGTQKCDTLLNDVASFVIGRDAKALVYRTGNRLRALDGSKIRKPKDDKPSRDSGWIDLARARVSIQPRAEWKQMYRDIWRLQREYFWVEDMSGVDWQRVYDRYDPLLDRVSTRAEFSDLIWEMQGELGTSHAYELGGDYRSPPHLPMGKLGADFVYDPGEKCYRIGHIVKGDSWDSDRNSPLLEAGAAIHEGDRLLGVCGRMLTEELAPESQLVNQSGVPVELTVANADGTNARRVTVLTLKNEMPARYREWVENNRRIVHERTNGRCGYVHIPDMGPRGYSEFHRYYSLEALRESLIIDVRYNGGGHVSPLILEKLGRKRIGYDFSRWGAPVPYPPESVLGPMVTLTNEHAGSDGDMFSHAFKLMKLGPLIGKRTWGGVIGISPRHRLVDGSLTTQPEYSFWFKDVGWGVENYGTDPDIEVDITPDDYRAGRDPQLEKGIELIIEALSTNPPALPDVSKKPKLPLPQLPV